MFDDQTNYCLSLNCFVKMLDLISVTSIWILEALDIVEGLFPIDETSTLPVNK